MRLLRRFWNRLRGTFTGRLRDAELAEEIESHLRMQTEDNLRLGMSPGAARRAAALKLGGVESTKELYRDQRGLPLLETIARDVRFGLRALGKERGVAAVCVLTLALAIGGNSAIFSAVNAVLLRPLRYPDAHQLVKVWETNPRANRWGDWASYPDFADWRRESRVFEDVAAFRGWSFRLTSGQYPEMLRGMRVSQSLFPVLRVTPMLGRSFLPEEDRPGQNQVAILGYGLWQRQFGSDPGLVGKTILIDEQPHMVVGIMPPGFGFPADIRGMPEPPDIWIPVGDDTDRGSHNYTVIARLKSDRTIQETGPEMERLAQIVARLDPGHRERGLAVAGLQERSVSEIRPALLILLGAILFVLLIACANVANLLLARGAVRQKEAALRQALGAGRARILKQWLTESVLLALLGGAAGLLVAFVGVRFLIRLGPTLPLLADTTIDPRVLVFTLLTALTTGVVFGMVPAFQALRVDVNEALKESGGRHAGSGRRSRIRSLLIVGEVALALMLLVGAGLLIRSFVHLRSIDMGFDDKKVLNAFLSVPPEAATDHDRTVGFFQDVIERVRAVPGVRDVAGASAVPLVSNESSPFRVEGRDGSDPDKTIVYAEQPKVTPSYFRTMGIRLMRGREFTWADTSTSQPVAIVSERLATAYWPEEDPIGKRLSIDDQQLRSVVGIVNDVRHDGRDSSVRPTIYIPLAQYS
ncbi:MAG: FtsX-like permease family protein, partial [Luteitalea sp.]|nr:FtsX-like permease family protein [Luteitalea sp.]